LSSIWRCHCVGVMLRFLRLNSLRGMSLFSLHRVPAARSNTCHVKVCHSWQVRRLIAPRSAVRTMRFTGGEKTEATLRSQPGALHAPQRLCARRRSRHFCWRYDRSGARAAVRPHSTELLGEALPACDQCLRSRRPCACTLLFTIFWFVLRHSHVAARLIGLRTRTSPAAPKPLSLDAWRQSAVGCRIGCHRSGCRAAARAEERTCCRLCTMLWSLSS
jgi:hypothetical protein